MRTVNRNRISIVLVWGFFLLLAGCTKDNNNEHRPRVTEPTKPMRQPKPIPLTGLFVDAQSKAPAPDGKSWTTAYTSIQDAIDASSGEQIIIAAGVYSLPQLRINDRRNIKLVGGYRSGEMFEKPLVNLDAKDMVVLDGDGRNISLLSITGKSRDITLQGGIIFRNVVGASALSIQGTAITPIKNIFIYNCQFIANRYATQKGAGVRIEHAQNVQLTEVRAQNNQAVMGGFLFARDVKNLSLERVLLRENKGIVGGNLSKGGALYAERVSLLSIKSSSVESSEAEQGGGIFLREAHQAVLYDVEFRDNKAPATVKHTFGGGLYIEDSDNIELTKLSMHNNNVKLTPGSTGGALAVVRSKQVTIDASEATLSHNKAYAGGAISFSKSDSITIKGGSFEHNESGQVGGALYFERNGAIRIANSKFSDNKAYVFGGAITVDGGKGKLSLEGLSFKRNEVSVSHGGALAVREHENFAISLTNCQFKENKAQGNGGAAIFKEIKGKVRLVADVFEGNKAQSYGGALALDGKSFATAQYEIGADVKFTQNRSEQKAGGGAIFLAAGNVYPPAAQLIINNRLGDYQQNSAGDGTLGTFLRVSNHEVEVSAPAAAPERGAMPGVFGAYPLLDISRFINDTAHFDFSEQQTIYLW